MRNFLLLALSFLIASCGNSGGGSSGKGVLDRYHDALQAQKPGFVIENNTTGTEYDIEYSDTTKLFSVRKVAYKSKEHEVVLKVEGDHVYKYVESSYGDYTNRSVVLESIALEAKWTEDLFSTIAFSNVAGYLVGTLHLDAPVSEYDSGDALASIRGGFHDISMNLNPANILCDYKASETTGGQTFTSPNLTTSLDNVTSVTLGTCPATISIEDLKKIDLTSIGFCDVSTESPEYNCKDGQDMSFLTADL